MIFDPIVDEVRRIREKLIADSGGFEGWVTHLQKMDSLHRQKAKRKRTAPARKMADEKKSRRVSRPTGRQP